MLRDPIPVLQTILREFLASLPAVGTVIIDGRVPGKIPWRPHLLEAKTLRGWYIHVTLPDSETWAQRITKAVAVKRKLRLGVAATEELFANEALLEKCHELGASILVYRQKGDSFVPLKFFSTVEDYIYSARLKLTAATVRKILDRSLNRALTETNKNRKGVLLELLVAVLLSQVDGFEVTSVGISNRSQQMDVLVHNRNVGGALGNSPIVLAEAKNWKDPVDVPEYAVFVRKLQSRHGRAKLGYLVSTGRFTAGVSAERRRESMNETLVVLIDGKSLPALWNDQSGISAAIEEATMTAAVGT